ncbi:MAG: hypothetical protein QOG22_2214 [Pseudonocardiales bacterium]|nr:hypothetical protein [Pseudonocardiales bacterium]
MGAHHMQDSAIGLDGPPLVKTPMKPALSQARSKIFVHTTLTAALLQNGDEPRLTSASTCAGLSAGAPGRLARIRPGGDES